MFKFKIFKKKSYTVWHQDSPGSKVVVHRNFFHELIYPKEFSGIGENYSWSGYEHTIDRTK